MKVIDTFSKEEYDIAITHYNRYHPAKFSDKILDILVDLIPKDKVVLDVCSGVGKLGHIKKRGWTGTIIGQEIEPEWALQACKNGIDIQYIADATDTINYSRTDYQRANILVTSVTYGNRMADHHNAKDGSIRYTYKHCIGRDLHENNTGRYKYKKYGEDRTGAYLDLHEKIWSNVALLSLDDIILNVSNFLVKGVERNVTQWHIDTLAKNGFALIEKVEIKTPRLRVGQNANKRVGCEYICILKRTKLIQL